MLQRTGTGTLESEIKQRGDAAFDCTKGKVNNSVKEMERPALIPMTLLWIFTPF